MKKKLNKIVALAIGINVLNVSTLPALAADNVESNYTSNVQAQVNQKPILTLDDAIKATISNSDKLAFKNKRNTNV